MKFVRGDKAAAVSAIAERLCQELQSGKLVLWLVAGGSNIPLEVEVMAKVREKAGDKLPGLAIMPMDERYGPEGHKDSNMQQLREQGFDPGAATFVDILTHGVNLEQTVSFYTDVAAAAISNAGVIIAQVGMGANGHIAGLQPGSPAVEPDTASVVGYKWDDFTRLTLTPMMLKQTTAAYVLVYGDDKKPALERLQKNTETFAKLPAKLLYDLPEAYVYTDVGDIGEAASTR